MSDDNFLSRWSRRKHQVRRGDEVQEAPPPPPPAAVDAQQQPVAVADAGAPVETPPLESLTPESDFTPFMNAKVDPGLRSQALKTLFSDPRYNVMDGLDVYIDDYSKPDPLPEGWLEKMNQVARLGDYQPPKEVEPEAEPQAQLASPDEAPVQPGLPEPEAVPEKLAAHPSEAASEAPPNEQS
jgi:Protein of unknown function (DUF3306).